MRIVKIRDAGQWIIPNTYIRVGGVWVLANNYVRYLGDWGDELVIYITATTTNVNLQSLFQATYPGSWAQTVPKRVVVNSGVIVGATDTSNYALNIPSGFGGTVKVDNNGSIQGAGGASNGGNGGPAILAGASGVTINNLGTIYGGGGGGGGGGTGGTGSYTAYVLIEEKYVPIRSWGSDMYYGIKSYTSSTPYGYERVYWGPYVQYETNLEWRLGTLTLANAASGFWGHVDEYTAQHWLPQNISSAGGVSGAGGVGQGYNQAATNGVGGSAGGTNAGTGGTGGTGGAFGTSGNTGGTGANGNNGVGAGGSGGGAAGYYIVNNGNVTWTTTGTRLGSVG